MVNDASGDEYNDDLEVEQQFDQVAEDGESEAACNPETTAIDEVEKGVDQSENTLPAEEIATSSTEQQGEPISDAETGHTLPRLGKSRQQNKRRGTKSHFGIAGDKDVEIAALKKKLMQAKKINTELHNQLQRFYTNDVIIQLENRVKEKQKRIDELLQENRTLKNSERLLTKNIEDIQNSKDDFPSKKRALQEELRVCKERIKQLKEQYRVADEKGFKLHQQSFDLAVKNKGLSEKLRLLETTTSTCMSPGPSNVRIETGALMEGPSSEEVQTILASQEEEITRLHQRVALMKKRHKAEHAKYERLLKTSQGEIDNSRAEMEQFYQQLFAKERAARVQFLHMKKLKHALHELANTQQTNQRFQPFLANREVRIMNRSNKQHQVGPQSPQKGPAIKAGRWITEALHHLGFVMPLSSQLDGSIKSPDENVTDEQADIPENCIQGRLVPVPPSATRFAGGASTRSQLYNNGSDDRARNNGAISDVSEESNDESSEKDQDTTVTPATTNATAHAPENPERRTILSGK
ncbi:hypothetical protein L917_05951 [Phytophthora nicotianae]|uniref:Lebercilin domain-containing protein n=2 Tax=Phytophthora nicotianae TaxID=4792 RepID=W2LGP5_PHYNI|nr:hypothetical protein L917_05951 [Phytophthora nicotianae]